MDENERLTAFAHEMGKVLHSPGNLSPIQVSMLAAYILEKFFSATIRLMITLQRIRDQTDTQENDDNL